MKTQHLDYERLFNSGLRLMSIALLSGLFSGLIVQNVSGEEKNDVKETPVNEPAALIEKNGCLQGVNVKDFGAKGDGKTDDTQAIRAAVGAARKMSKIPQHPQYGYFVTFAEVYFPSGHYVVTETIDIDAVKLRGENYAAIEQTSADKDIFFFPYAWRQLVEGLSFLGGKVQLNLGNPNVDTGHVTVRDCHFLRSNGVAVQMREGSNSTFFKVENCLFKSCAQAIVNHCDMNVIRDCWITTSQGMRDQAAIVNHGTMHVENLLGVPIVRRGEDGFSEDWNDPLGRKHTGSNQRWIDNHNVLHIDNSRFGGEGGGFSAVYNFARYQQKYPVIPSSVIIENSYLYNAQSTAIVLKEIPNTLTVVNCTGLVDAWVVRVDPKLDLDTYFSQGSQNCRVSINLANNSGGLGSGLPEQLLPYQVNELISATPPSKGQWTRGQFIRNPNLEGHYTPEGYVKEKRAAEDEPYGWYCVETGRPGNWKEIRLKTLFE